MCEHGTARSLSRWSRFTLKGLWRPVWIDAGISHFLVQFAAERGIGEVLQLLGGGMQAAFIDADGRHEILFPQAMRADQRLRPLPTLLGQSVTGGSVHQVAVPQQPGEYHSRGPRPGD